MDKWTQIITGMFLSMGQVGVTLLMIFSKLPIETKVLTIALNCLTIVYLEYPLYMEVKKAKRINDEYKLKEKAMEKAIWQEQLRGN